MREQVSRKYIKECFRKVKVQIPEDTIDAIVRELRIKVTNMAKKSKDGNVKRLTPDLMFIALGRLNDFKR